MIRIWRNGKSANVKVVAGKFPQTLARELGFRLLGIKVADLSVNNRRQYNISADTGVMITDLLPNSYLAGIGARRGDVIRRINEIELQDTEDFTRAVVKYRHKNSIIILLQRADQGYYITVEI